MTNVSFYDPKTAFGNPTLLKIIRKDEETQPYDDEEKRTHVIASIFSSEFTMEWTCPKCNFEHSESNDHEYFEENQQCEGCGQKFILDF